MVRQIQSPKEVTCIRNYKECGTFVPGNGLAIASNRHAQ